MAKKEIQFSQNPFDALLKDAKKASTLTTPSTPSVDTTLSTPINETLRHPLSQVQRNYDSRSQSDRSDFRYGEVRSKAAPPHKFIKKTYEITPEHRSLLFALSFMKRIHIRDAVAEAFSAYFMQPEHQKLLKDLKKENPEKYEFLFSYQMDSSSMDEKNSS
jgi:hypothetical protein